MKLEQHLSQGKLLYLSKHEDAISISENDHFRWMAFNDVVQSIMHKRKPYSLTLPHQIALLLPLLLFRPKNIIELGLGGGNLTRFLTHLSAEIKLTSLEYNQQVISCFAEHFNPDKAAMNIIHNDGLSWLAQQETQHLDWVICDVYRSDEFGFNSIVKQLEILTSKLNSQSCLSINLPDISDDEINLSLTILQQLQISHHINYFHIPNYLNIVIHLYPKHWPLHRLLKQGARRNNSYLSQRVFNRWRTFWPHGISL
jgi:spermidine synthase